MNDLVDCKEIAEILGYAGTNTARSLCKSGHLKSAVKKGNSWVADRDEVLSYKNSPIRKSGRPRITPEDNGR